MYDAGADEVEADRGAGSGFGKAFGVSLPLLDAHGVEDGAVEIDEIVRLGEHEPEQRRLGVVLLGMSPFRQRRLRPVGITIRSRMSPGKSLFMTPSWP